MQVTEIKTEGLKREFKICVPAGDIEQKITSRLGEIARTAHMPGFRPGKVPPAVLRKRYGQAVMGEVLEQAVNETSLATLNDRGLRAALRPQIEVTVFDQGKDLEYTMAVEVMPTIETVDFKGLELERLVAEASDEDLTKSLERLAQAHKDSKPVEGKRKAKAGDVVVIDFVGRVDGTEFPGGKADGYHLELGSGSFIPGFEDQLIGAGVGNEVLVKVSFPKEYGAADLAGKDAEFSVTVQELRETVSAAVDDELAKKVGMDTLDALKKVIRDEHDREFKNLSRQRLKRSLLDALAEKHAFEVPAGMVDLEFDNIWKQFEEHRKAGMEDEEDKAKSEDDKKAELRAIAERRVRLGLLLGEIGRLNNIQIGQDEVNRAIMNEARRYPGQEKAVFDYLRGNPAALEQVTAPLYEDKVVDFVIEMVKVNERKVTAEELMKDPDDEAKPAADAKPEKAEKKKAASAPKKSSGTKKAAKKED
ncbi:MAG: trigger factor [Magnetospirillum sp. WYHS-4]